MKGAPQGGACLRVLGLRSKNPPRCICAVYAVWVARADHPAHSPRFARAAHQSPRRRRRYSTGVPCAGTTLGGPMNLNEILQAAFEADASDVHLIAGQPP